MKRQAHRRPHAIATGTRTARRALLAVGLMLSAHGCAHNNLPNIARALHRQPADLAQSAPAPTLRHASSPASSPTVAPGKSSSSHAAVSTARGGSSVVPVSYDAAVAPDPNDASLVQNHMSDEPGFASANSSCNCPTCIGGSAACPPSDAPCGPMMPPGPVPPYWNDQEYLYDGGDREPRVQVTQGWEVRGLDSQDTVAHYETLDGKLCVAASNRVPIYAPRFGAIRKTSAPVLAARAVGAQRMVEPTGAVVQASRDQAGDLALPQGPQHRDAIRLIDGLRDRTRGVPAEKFTPAVDLTNYQAALNRLQNHTTSIRREDLLAILGQYMVNARTWINTDAIAVSLGGVQAIELKDAKQVQDIHVYETEPDKCSLRICKASSHSAASPGDIINFSIRFDNVGNKPIGNLVILDSLVTRLEYIDGSQQCVLSLASSKSSDKETNPVKFSTAENEAGSTVLRWEADLPLEAGDSGVITFRCRVR
jgi:uncharacterized repeat protein (TIGR01451 family)